MFSKSSNSENKQSQSAPTIGMNQEVSVQDVVKMQGNTPNEASVNNEVSPPANKEVVNEEELKNAILGGSKPEPKISTPSTPSSSNTSAYTPPQRSNNNKYQYTDLYEDPNTGRKPKNDISAVQDIKQNESTDYSPPIKKKKEKKRYYDVLLIGKKNKAYNGGTLDFVLQQDAEYEGEKFKKGTVFSGIVNIQNNRIYVKFTSVTINYETYPIAFTLCNSQGIEGIGIKQNEDNSQSTRSTAGSVASGALSSIPIIGGIVGGAINDATNKKSKQSYNIPDSYRAKITSFEGDDIY